MEVKIPGSASPGAIVKIVCRGCYAVLDAGDSFCRCCGAATTGTVAARPANDGSRNLSALSQPFAGPGAARGKWTESPWFVLLVLFLVLGPLGLPLLWRSRRISRLWKFLLTALMVGLTAWILGLIWYTLDKALEPLRELHQLQR
jgi:hypothetical protein